jgi:hypothetical protein
VSAARCRQVSGVLGIASLFGVRALGRSPPCHKPLASEAIASENDAVTEDSQGDERYGYEASDGLGGEIS